MIKHLKYYDGIIKKKFKTSNDIIMKSANYLLSTDD